MTAKPILFSTPMVQAIIAGRKTMTRRIIPENIQEMWLSRFWDCVRSPKHAKYQVGDILWVRETWMPETEQGIPTGGYIYKATNRPEPDGDTAPKWRSSRYMPKSAARLFLRVTGVRAERLQEISEDDAIAEGFRNTHGMTSNWSTDNEYGALAHTGKEAFMGLWDSLNAKRGYGWDTNPFVWVYTFERCDRPEGWCE